MNQVDRTMGEVSALLDAQDQRDVRRRDAGHAVWCLKWPGLLARGRRTRIENQRVCRRDLLVAVLGTPPAAFLRHPDSPHDYDVPGTWQCVAEQTWRVSGAAAIDNRPAASWLALGCWIAYAAKQAVADPWPDMFRIPAPAASAWITAHDVDAAIVSFHDDDEWMCVLAARSRG